MRRDHLKLVISISLLLVFTTACAAAPPTAQVVIPSPTTEVLTVNGPVEEPAPEAEQTDEALAEIKNRLEDFDPVSFDDSTTIDNPWFPMLPGTQWVYDGSTEDSGLVIPHQIIFTVTDLTKVVGGVRTVVVYIEDYSEDELVEAEIAFYAQDKEGNIWFLGEYPEEYENGEYVDSPAWIAGFKGARAGIKMKAEPKEGLPSYSQGWGPAVNWTDYGQIDQMGLEDCVPLDCYTDVLVIAESSQDEKDAYQLKYYAQGIGEFRVGWRGVDANRENLELIKYELLDPDALEQIRDKALGLEKNAFNRSKEVYALSSPLELPSP